MDELLLEGFIYLILANVFDHKQKTWIRAIFMTFFTALLLALLFLFLIGIYATLGALRHNQIEILFIGIMSLLFAFMLSYLLYKKIHHFKYMVYKR